VLGQALVNETVVGGAVEAEQNIGWSVAFDNDVHVERVYLLGFD
jgi:hypothetical protein